MAGRLRSAAAKPAKSLEATLWDAADKLRGNLEAAEYKHVVLGLVFLKYVFDAFTARRLQLDAAISDPDSEDYIPSESRREGILESRDEYAGRNVFWISERARWEHLVLNAKQPGIGGFIDEAMDLIEHENPSLKGVLPKNFGRAELDKRLLGELVDQIGGIGFTGVDHGSDDVLGKVYEYFLGKFAGQEGRNAGEFYTPRSVVRLLVEMLEPYHGRVYDPCCGCVQGHHIRFWSRGGRTALSNLILLCSYHHRQIHQGGFSVAVDQHGQFVFGDPAGRPLDERRPQSAWTGSPLPPAERTCFRSGAASASTYAVWMLLSRRNYRRTRPKAQPAAA